MKIFAASLITLGLLTGAANASPQSAFQDLGASAPRSVFADIASTAPNSAFDQLGDSAPRSAFDDISSTAPHSKAQGFFMKLRHTAP